MQQKNCKLLIMSAPINGSKSCVMHQRCRYLDSPLQLQARCQRLMCIGVPFTVACAQTLPWQRLGCGKNVLFTTSIALFWQPNKPAAPAYRDFVTCAPAAQAPAELRLLCSWIILLECGLGTLGDVQLPLQCSCFMHTFRRRGGARQVIPAH